MSFFKHRYDLKTELSLALLPTLTMGAVLLLLEKYSQQHLLFASLASSAFLIYLNPQHPTNSIRTLGIAQVSAALIGFGTVHLIGPGCLCDDRYGAGYHPDDFAGCNAPAGGIHGAQLCL